MAAHDILFQLLTINDVTIANRFLSTSHQSGYPVDGNLTERYICYEAKKSKGSVGLIQFAGAPQYRSRTVLPTARSTATGMAWCHSSNAWPT